MPWQGRGRAGELCHLLLGPRDRSAGDRDRAGAGGIDDGYPFPLGDRAGRSDIDDRVFRCFVLDRFRDHLVAHVFELGAYIADRRPRTRWPDQLMAFHRRCFAGCLGGCLCSERGAEEAFGADRVAELVGGLDESAPPAGVSMGRKIAPATAKRTSRIKPISGQVHGLASFAAARRLLRFVAGQIFAGPVPPGPRPAGRASVRPAALASGRGQLALVPGH